MPIGEEDPETEAAKAPLLPKTNVNEELQDEELQDVTSTPTSFNASAVAFTSQPTLESDDLAKKTTEAHGDKSQGLETADQASPDATPSDTKVVEVVDPVAKTETTVADYCCGPACVESCQGIFPEGFVGCCGPLCTCLYNIFRSLPIGSGICYFLFQFGSSMFVNQWVALDEAVPFDLSDLGALLGSLGGVIHISMLTALITTILTEGWCGEKIADLTTAATSQEENGWMCCLASAAWCIGCAGQWVDIWMLYLAAFITLIVLIIAAITVPITVVLVALCKTGHVAIAKTCPPLSMMEHHLTSAFLSDITKSMCHCSEKVHRDGTCTTGFEASPHMQNTCAETWVLTQCNTLLIIATLLITVTVYSQWGLALKARSRMSALGA